MKLALRQVHVSASLLLLTLSTSSMEPFLFRSDPSSQTLASLSQCHNVIHYVHILFLGLVLMHDPTYCD